MKFFFALILTVVLLFEATFVRALEHKGMTLGLFANTQASYNKELRELRAIGVNHVSLIVSWYQKDVYGNELHPLFDAPWGNFTLKTDLLRKIIRDAKKMGIKTLLFPIIRLETRKGKEWRGVIAPTNLEEWWKSYENYILTYAKIAAEENVDTLSLGSELLSRESDTEKWKALIKKVRQVYSGKLVYSANWDHFKYPQFWGDIDYVGITAYHELTNTNDPTLEAMKLKWKEIQKEILDWKKQYPKQKLLFTEIGYHSVDGTNRYPWNYFLKGAIDTAEQALCYRAFVESWKNIPDLAGVYFWVWWGAGGLQDNNYTPKGKPAEKILREWYRSGK